MVLGLHIVKKKLKLFDRYYVYAWRGGPCIHTQDRSYPALTPELLHKHRLAVRPAQNQVPAYTFHALLDRYELSPEFTSLAPSTKQEYRRLLAPIAAEFGSLPYRSFELPELKGEIHNYRDRFVETPRKADALVTMLATVLSWAVKRGELTHNPAANIGKLHRSNRSDLIWESRHWLQIQEAKLPPHIQKVIDFLGLVGLRLGDAIQITWDAVQEHSIEYAPRKGKRHNARASVPLYNELQAWIDHHRPQHPQHPPHILLTSRGTPWTEDGFEASYRKVRPKGFDRTLHDLRGTFATRILMAGGTDTDAAMALGWSTKRVEDIRRRYVNEQRILRNLGAKLSQRTSSNPDSQSASCTPNIDMDNGKSLQATVNHPIEPQ